MLTPQCGLATGRPENPELLVGGGGEQLTPAGLAQGIIELWSGSLIPLLVVNSPVFLHSEAGLAAQDLVAIF